jgi:hypothetical protein
LIFPVELPTTGFIEEVNPGNCVKIDGKAIHWQSVPASDFFYTDLNSGPHKINSWKIENTHLGLGVSETAIFEPAQCNLWGRHYVISPEIFFKIKLQPGAILKWVRRFEFYSNKKSGSTKWLFRFL